MTQLLAADAISSQIVERAVKKSRANRIAWVLGTFLLAIFVIAGMIVWGIQMGIWKTSPVKVHPRLPAAEIALSKLGERQAAIGYSLRLPAGFAGDVPPSTADLPAGSQSHSWTAAQGSDDEGSFLHLFVIAQQGNILQTLHSRQQLEYPPLFSATIVNKSAYRRIGDDDLVAVRGLLAGQEDQRPGIVYFVEDGPQTLMLIGAGSGRRPRDVQYLLDHAVRTLRRAP
ncbi:MAG: hypothetical protein GTO03_13215 [Planctomycetales bacterium]|nr:hypothetical protein [Planctomycetales bacterium]